MDNQAGEDDVFGHHPDQFYSHNDWPTPVAAFEPEIVTEDARVGSVPEVVPPRSGAKRVKQKNVARGGLAFTQEEDKVICSAFLNISKDPITGVNQSTGGYYKRIHDYYVQHRPEGSSRSQMAIQHRWQIIQKGVSRFSGLKSSVDRRNESGKCEQDRIDDAVQMYEKTESFAFMQCWKLLRKEAKWNDRLLELNRPSPTMNSVPASQTSANEHVDRPEGRDSAKKRKSNGGDACSSNTAVEVLQQIHERNGKSEEKQDQQMQVILNMKEKMFDLQKEDMEKRSRLKEEQLQLAKKDIEVREKQTETQLVTVELGIMGVDLEKFTAPAKAYYIMMQKQIMERRGIVLPPDSDE